MNTIVGWATLPPRTSRTRRLAAWLLKRASLVLGRWASRLAPPVAIRRPARVAWPIVEVHAEAGAPEGALYVDGAYVGRLEINRL
jgi:hypothetical protein